MNQEQIEKYKEFLARQSGNPISYIGPSTAGMKPASSLPNNQTAGSAFKNWGNRIVEYFGAPYEAVKMGLMGLNKDPSKLANYQPKFITPEKYGTPKDILRSQARNTLAVGSLATAVMSPTTALQGAALSTGGQAYQNVKEGRGLLEGLDSAAVRGVENSAILAVTNVATDKIIGSLAKNVGPELSKKLTGLVGSNVQTPFKYSKTALDSAMKNKAFKMGVERVIARALSEVPMESIAFGTKNAIENKEKLIQSIINDIPSNIMGNLLFAGLNITAQGANVYVSPYAKELKRIIDNNIRRFKNNERGVIVPGAEIGGKKIGKIKPQGLDAQEVKGGDLGYRAGNVGDVAETYADQLGSRRSTGHFGTGTYFFGDEAKAKNYAASDGINKARPVNTIDLKGKNMFKPKNADDGIKLHETLKEFNNLIQGDGFFAPDMIAKDLQDIGIKNITPDDIDSVFKDYVNGAKLLKEGDMWGKARDIDTPSTILMKKLGYDGIDVRGIKELDNGVYGSVLYRQANKVGGKTIKIKSPKIEQQPIKVKQPEVIKIKEPQKISLERNKVDKFLTKVKTAFENSLAPVDDVLNDFELKTNSKIRPQNDFRIQADKVIGSASLSAQYAKDNGLNSIVEEAYKIGDLKEFGEYLAARHAPEVEAQGYKTGRNIAEDTKFVKATASKYEELAQKAFAYNRKLLDDSVESGLVSRAGRDFLVKTYPNYVPFNRILKDPEIVNSLNSRQIGSISQQRLVKKLIGSELEIRNPLYNMFENTVKAINDIERNKAARMMASYKDLEGNPFNIKELDKNAYIGDKHTFSFLDNGTKRTFEVSKDVEAALKSLDVEESNIVLKIVSVPTRILQMGATGLNVPFVVTNYVKDQQFAFITSNKAAQTSFVNPVNTVRGMYEAVGRGDLYEQVVREAGITSQFDIARGDPKVTLESVASKQDLKSRIAYTAKNPLELLRTLENVVGTTEYATRIQQFKGTYDSYKAQGASDETARLYAGQAARENTANFRRSGNVGKVVNKFIPFFNAGIQGAKSLRRAFLKNPKGTSLKVLLSIGIPAAVSTVSNLNDEKKKAVYDDIQEWEKEGNFIIIPDNPEKDEQGRWKVIKIPINPGLQGHANIIRKFIEKGSELDASFIPYIAKNLFNITTSVQVDNPISQFTPQVIKPFIESTTNRNLFTGKDIVPSNMKYLDKEEQVYPWTSGTARAIGKVFNMSPIMVQNLIGTIAGGSGKQALNISDNILNKAGLVPDGQVGGESAMDNIVRRFTLASGGAEADRVEQEAKQGMTQLEVATYDFLNSYKSKANKGNMTVGEKEWFKIGENALKLSNPKVAEALRAEAMIKAFYNDEPQNPFNMLTEGQRKIVLTINSLPKGEDKSALQKENIEWLKPYWEANANYFAYKSIKAYEESGAVMEESKQPIASEYVQKQMDLGNWNDPQVKAYLEANTAYKNYIRESMGLPPLEGYSGGGGYDPMKYFNPTAKKVKIKIPKAKKISLKGGTYKKIKTRRLTPKKISITPVTNLKKKIKIPKANPKVKLRA